MKLDAGVEIWFAWQEGESKTLCSTINNLIGTGYKARLPSALWKFYTEKNESVIIRAIMLSNEWSIYIPLTWTDGARYRFARGGGPPQLEQSGCSYRNYIIVTD
jgi:hypothetical protein